MAITSEELVDMIQELNDLVHKMPPNRPMSMVKTKLDEARMWAEENRKLGG